MTTRSNSRTGSDRNRNGKNENLGDRKKVSQPGGATSNRMKKENDKHTRIEQDTKKGPNSI